MSSAVSSSGCRALGEPIERRCWRRRLGRQFGHVVRVQHRAQSRALSRGCTPRADATSFPDVSAYPAGTVRSLMPGQQDQSSLGVRQAQCTFERRKELAEQGTDAIDGPCAVPHPIRAVAGGDTQCSSGLVRDADQVRVSAHPGLVGDDRGVLASVFLLRGSRRRRDRPPGRGCRTRPASLRRARRVGARLHRCSNPLPRRLAALPP